ncbi:superinfection immunity protein [Sulfobacillus thermosulfidooxidans]|uniref:superinfection immunity protein n=1 Tax=Sulfobacillus thermosulfidooxidans TaxID=28034 RepID=UPI0006B66AC6|nr:superinfection immunity protein [Sulfobacillus thermosulfidooxidans]
MSIAAIILFVVLVLGILVGIGIYFLPTILAFTRHKTNRIAILALNALLGWGLIGWVVSLVWALSQDPT